MCFRLRFDYISAGFWEQVHNFHALVGPPAAIFDYLILERPGDENVASTNQQVHCSVAIEGHLW